MSAINESVTNMIEPKSTDERVRKLSPWRILLDRPELGSIAGTVLVFAFFGVFAGGSGMFALARLAPGNWILAVGGDRARPRTSASRSLPREDRRCSC
jgi:simple sugar transport system permease protein